MLRLSAIFLVLTATTAWAGESLESRIHAAAVEACAPEAVSQAVANRPLSHYGAITDRCVARISNSAMATYQARAEAKLQASTAANN